MTPTLTEAIETFIRVCRDERRLSSHTEKAYRIDLKQFSSFILANRTARLDEISREDVSRFLAQLPNLKPRSIRRKLATLKSFFSHFERESIISINPIRLIRLNIQMGRRLPRTVSLENMKTLLAHLRKRVRQCSSSQHKAVLLRDQAIFETLFFSGMRVGELANLKTTALDLHDLSILVPGKGNRERVIPICSKPVAKILSRYAAQRRKLGSEHFFFLNRGRKRLSEQSIRNALRHYSGEAALPKITPHMIRHTVATLLLGRGADLRNIQILLGHSSITTTTIYAHVNEAMQRTALTTFHPRHLF
jgi:integrase/recombinase XerD